MDHEVLKKIEKALEGNKTLQKLTLSDAKHVHRYDIYDANDMTLPKDFCRHHMIGIGHNASLSEVHLSFHPHSWDCPEDGRLVYVSHMLQLDV